MITIKKIKEDNFEWALFTTANILLNEEVVGYVTYGCFNKESIYSEIYEDHAFYMDEDTHMREYTAQFILDNLNNKDCTYIDEIYINPEFRRKHIGSSVLNLLMNTNFPNNSFILRAGPLGDDIGKCHSDKSYADSFKNSLYKFYTSLGFNNYNEDIFYKNF